MHGLQKLRDLIMCQRLNLFVPRGRLPEKFSQSGCRVLRDKPRPLRLIEDLSKGRYDQPDRVLGQSLAYEVRSKFFRPLPRYLVKTQVAEFGLDVIAIASLIAIAGRLPN